MSDEIYQNGASASIPARTAPRLEWVSWLLDNTPFHLFVLKASRAGDPNVGKQPAYSGGCWTASRDRATLEQEFTRNPFANIGVAYWMSGHCLVELDVKDAAKNGVNTWTGLQIENTAAPETLTFRSWSGGVHMIFHDPEGVVRNSAGRLGAGIDTRGEGGYGVGPGSMIEGKPYTVEKLAPIAELPQWVADLYGRAPEYEPREPGEYEEEWAVEYGRQEMRTERGYWGVYPEPGAQDQLIFGRAVRLNELGVPKGDAAAILEEWAAKGQWHGATRDGRTLADFIEHAYDNRQGTWSAFGSQLPPKPASASERFGEAFDAAGIKPPQSNAGGAFPSSKPKLILRRLGSMKFEPISWLWLDWLAAGKLHIFGGQKGAGKSSVLYDLAARVSVGAAWPDNSPGVKGTVLVWSSEDDAKDTIGPRVAAAGGDPNRVVLVEGTQTGNGEVDYFDPARDMALLIEAAREIPDLKLVIIDPVVSVVDGDSYKNAEVRRALQPLVNLAAECGAAIVGITHFTKGTQGKDPVERITGSIAFAAIARIVWGAVKGETEDDPRLFVRMASNIGKGGDGFQYTLCEAPVPGYGFKAQTIQFDQLLEGSAAKLINDYESGGEKSELRQAMAWLKRKLADSGGMTVPQVMSAARADGHAWRTVERARQKMGDAIKSRPTAGGDGRTYEWSLDPLHAFREVAPQTYIRNEPPAKHPGFGAPLPSSFGGLSAGNVVKLHRINE